MDLQICINVEIQEEHLSLGLPLMIQQVVFKPSIILTTPPTPLVPCCSFFCVILASFNNLSLSELRVLAFFGRSSFITV